MAIDLNKSHYNNGRHVRSVTPEKEVPEIYPQKNIPQNEHGMPAETPRPEIYPQGSAENHEEAPRRLSDDTQNPPHGYNSADIFGKKADVLGQKIGAAFEEFFNTTDDPPQNNAPVQNDSSLPRQNIAPRSGEYYSGNAAQTEYKEPEKFPEKHFEVKDDFSPNPNNYQMAPPQNQTEFAPARIKKKKRKKKKGLILAILAIVAIVALSVDVREMIRDAVNPLIEQSLSVYEGDFSVPLADVEKLKIESDNLKINLTPSDGDEFKVSYSTYSDIEVLHSVENGVLRIYTDGSYGFHLMGFMDFSDSEINVTVPSSYAGDINVVGKNGEIELNEISTAGNVVCENTNGAIEAERVSAASLKLSSKNSKIEMEDVIVSGLAEADSTNGRITAGFCEFNGGADFKSTNGRIETESCSFKGDSTLRSENGSCEFSDVTVENLDVTTKNGAIHGNIIGKEMDYSISANAKNGSCNVSNRTVGKYSLKFRSENGSINVDFDD